MFGKVYCRRILSLKFHKCKRIPETDEDCRLGVFRGWRTRALRVNLKVVWAVINYLFEPFNVGSAKNKKLNYG